MNLKMFLPVEDYTLTTKLSVDEVRSRIQYKTEPKSDIGFFAPKTDSSKPYEGVVTANSFKITRIIDYRNSFLPVITGNFSNYLGGTEVKIKMRLPSFAKIFVLVFLVSIGITLILNLSIFLRNTPTRSSFSLIITFISLVFFVLLTYFAFKRESKISKQFLANLLEAQLIKS